MCNAGAQLEESSTSWGGRAAAGGRGDVCGPYSVRRWRRRRSPEMTTSSRTTAAMSAIKVMMNRKRPKLATEPGAAAGGSKGCVRQRGGRISGPRLCTMLCAANCTSLNNGVHDSKRDLGGDTEAQEQANGAGNNKELLCGSVHQCSPVGQGVVRGMTVGRCGATVP